LQEYSIIAPVRNWTLIFAGFVTELGSAAGAASQTKNRCMFLFIELMKYKKKLRKKIAKFSYESLK